MIRLIAAAALLTWAAAALVYPLYTDAYSDR